MVPQLVKSIKNAHEDGVWAVAWSKRSNRIVTGSVDDTLKVWHGDLTSPAKDRIGGDKKDDVLPLCTLEGHQLGIVSVDVNSQGTMAVSTSLDSQIRLWSLQANSVAKVIDPGPVEAWTAAFSPDGRFIAAGSHSGAINIWNVDTGEKEIRPLETKGKFIMSVAYSPNGSQLVAGSENGAVYMFDVVTGKLIHTIQGHAMAVRSISFSPEGRHWITASDDKRINLYDSHSGNPISTMSAHTSWVLSVSYSPDGRHFASGSSDKRVKIWDADSKQCVHTFDSHTDQVWGVAYNEDGSKLASVSDDCTLNVYQTGV